MAAPLGAIYRWQRIDIRERGKVCRMAACVHMCVCVCAVMFLRVQWSEKGSKRKEKESEKRKDEK